MSSTNMGFDWLHGGRDEEMSRLMVDLWTNFATYKNPTPKDSGIDGTFQIPNSKVINSK